MDRGLPLISKEILGSPFKLAAYFDAEERDDTWAAVMEASIREALAAQPSTRAWNPLAVECRTTLCQIRASTDPAAAHEFKIFYEKVPGKTDTTYTIDHISGVYLLDPHGRVRLFEKQSLEPALMTEDIKALLAEKA